MTLIARLAPTPTPCMHGLSAAVVSLRSVGFAAPRGFKQAPPGRPVGRVR